MFERAEIVFVSRPGSDLSHAAEDAMRAGLERVNMADRYVLHSAVLLPEADPLVLGTKHRGEPSSTETLNQQLVAQADLILVINGAEREAVLREFPGAERRIFLLAEPAGTAPDDSSGEPSLEDEAPDIQRQAIEARVQGQFGPILHQADLARNATMARVGLSNVIFDVEPVRPSMAETLGLFSRAGARFVDWCLADSTAIYSPAEMDHFAELLEANDLRCEMVHGVENPEVHAVSQGEDLDRYVAVQSNVIELCARLGGDTVVMHLPGLFWYDAELSFIQAMENTTIAMDRLRPLCETLGVRLAVENIPEQSDSAMLDFYFGRYPASFVTFCLDVGHANIGDPRRLEKLKGYAPRLSALHLHDNRGTEDDHQPPFFGTIDWAALLGWLHEIGYTRSLNFELVHFPNLFGGTPEEFVDHAVRQIRRALFCAPEATHARD